MASHPTLSKIDEKIEQLRNKRTELELGGGQKRIDKQHKQGKLTGRERINQLADEGSFQEIGLFARHRQTNFGLAEQELPADGVITGCATVDGRLVHLGSHDFTVAGGSTGEIHAEKIVE